MYINTEAQLKSAINSLQSKLESWIQFLYASDPYIFNKAAVATLLFIILVIILKKNKKTTDETCPKVSNPAASPGGYKNFRGDTWYPDGRIWHEDTQKWEMPDYNPKKQNTSPSPEQHRSETDQ